MGVGQGAGWKEGVEAEGRLGWLERKITGRVLLAGMARG